MPFLKWFSLAALLALGVGCIGPSGTQNGSEVEVTIQASFEKKVLTPSGFSGVVTKPARYCYAEIRQSSPDQLFASGYLSSEGTGSTFVPQGMKFYVQVFAEVAVPATASNSTFFHGSVRDGLAPMPGSDYATRVQALAGSPRWWVATEDYTADRSLSVPVLARSSGGAFNIADQMSSFGLKVRDTEPALRLPSLHAYWTNGALASSQYLLYPTVISDEARNLVYQESAGPNNETRAVFTASFHGQQGGVPDAETDEFDDAVLQKSFFRLLFANRSLKADGSDWASLLRRDNDNMYVSPYLQSESTAAFVAGACDFLSGATLGDSRLMDSYNDGSGVFRVETFDLALHNQIDSTQRGVFTRGSIAASLWGMYRNSLGGGASGLQVLWGALRSNVSLSDGTGEYNGATLGCYPSYLLGVKSRISGSQWSSVLGELLQESIPEPTQAYFNGSTLYLPLAVGQTTTGSVQTYDDGWNMDRNQSQAYRFAQNTTASRTITLIPSGTQELFLEVLGPGGLWGARYSAPYSLTLPNLPTGYYAVRVRAGDATNATTTATFSLSVQ